MKIRIYAAVLATYFIVFLVPLTTGLISYNQAVAMAEKELQDSSLTSLIRCVETVDSRLEATDRLVGQLSLVADFSGLQSCETPYENRDIIPLLTDFQKLLDSYLSPESFVSNTFVCFNRPAVAISHRYVFLSLKELYEFAFGKTALSEEAFAAAMKGDGPSIRQVGNVHLNSVFEDMLVYVHPYPLGPRLDGSVVAMISKSKIFDVVNAVFPQRESLFYIVDQDGGAIASFNTLPFGGEITEADIERYDMNAAEGVLSYEGDHRLFVSYAVSPRTGWRYVVALPEEAVLQDLNMLRDLNTLMIVIGVLVGSGVVALFAFQQSRMTFMLSALLHDRLGVAYAGSKRDVDKLRRSLTGIISDNQSLQKRLQDQLPMLRNTYVEKLLKGGFDSEEILQFGRSIGFEWSDTKRIVLLMEISASLTATGTGSTEYTVIMLLLRDVLKLYFHQIYFYNIDYRSEAYIVEVGELSKEELRAQAESILEGAATLIREKYQVTVRFSAGAIFTDITYAADSFEKAREAMGSRSLYVSSPVIWYDMLDSKPHSFYYPLELEARFAECVREGATTAAQAVLSQVYEENLQKRQLPDNLLDALASDVFCTLLKLWGAQGQASEADTAALEADFAAMERSRDFQERFHLLRRICDRLCALAPGYTRATGKTGRAIEAIAEYLTQQYHNPNLNLNAVAAKFAFSPPYLSRAFKEHIGATFSMFLENIRIEEACRLLEKDMTIDDISSAVGYGSVIAFRKAFKRLRGEPPSEYRQRRSSGMEELKQIAIP